VPFVLFLFFSGIHLMSDVACNLLYYRKSICQQKSSLTAKNYFINIFAAFADKSTMPIIMMDDRIEICLGNNVDNAQCGMDSGVCEGCEEFKAHQSHRVTRTVRKPTDSLRLDGHIAIIGQRNGTPAK
jgi:hypothetical protein